MKNSRFVSDSPIQGPSITLQSLPVTNKLAAQNHSAFSQTFTFGQKGTRKDEAHDSGYSLNSVDDCIRGYFPRARSGGSIKTRVERVSKRYHSDSAVMRCEKLPSVSQNLHLEKQPSHDSRRLPPACSSINNNSFRPWSKTSIELQKYKESLQNV